MLSSLTLNHVVITLTTGHNELRRRIYWQKRCCGEGGGGVWGSDAAIPGSRVEGAEKWAAKSIFFF